MHKWKNSFSVHTMQYILWLCYILVNILYESYTVLLHITNNISVPKKTIKNVATTCKMTTVTFDTLDME